MDQFIHPKNITDLGLICDAANPMSKQDKQGAALLVGALQNRDPSTNTIEFTDIGDTLDKIGSSDIQTSDVAGTSNTPHPLSITVPRPSTSRSIMIDYMIVLQSFMIEVMKRLRIVATKV